MNGQPPRYRLRFLIFSGLFATAALAVLVYYGTIMLAERRPSAGTGAAIAERGPILDRNGRILAMQTRMGNVTVWKPEIVDLPPVAKELAKILGVDEKELFDRIRNSSGDFVYIKRKVDQTALDAIEAARSAGKLPGVGIEPTVGRVYPEKRLASQLVGFVGDDNRGLAGTEYALQTALSPDGSYGDQVFLTIDANAQHLMEDIARRSLEENKAEAVISLAVDAKTGEVLAYVSLPDYDPNDIRASTEKDRMDRVAVWAYEPGSVFKVFSVAGIMELGGISDHSTFTCNGAYERTSSSGEKIVIKCLGSHGTVTPEDIIKYSCNSGAAYAADRVDAQSFESMVEAFGFGSKTGTGLPGETAGFIRSVDKWSLRSKPTIAIGQELAVSAMQMVQAATAIANDGVLVKPRVVSRIVGPDGTVKRVFGPEYPRRVLSPETARAMRRYMLSASSEAGTGRRASVEDMRLAVKTGTAQLIDPATGAYSKTDYLASCMALLPADDPKLILYHVIIRPKGDSYLGGRIAAPPIREAAEALADYFGIPRGRNQLATHPGTVAIPAEGPIAVSDVMPDLRGVAKRRLLPLLGREDIVVEIVGDGWVKRQDPPPGTPVERGSKIRLELE